MKYGRAAGYGLGFALIGLVLWVAIAAVAHRDIAFLALAVGGLAGLGVFLAVREPPKPKNNLGYSFRVRLPKDKSEKKERDFKEIRYGLLAAVIAVAVACAGKVAAAALAMAVPSKAAATTVAEEDLIRVYADSIVHERQGKGQKLTFPKNMKLSQPYYPDEYPSGIWSEAEGKWKQLSAAEQKSKLDEKKKVVEKAVQDVKSAVQGGPSIWDNIVLADALLVVLAAAAAFGIVWLTNRPDKKKADGGEVDGDE